MNGKLLNAFALLLVAVAAGLIGYRNFDWGGSPKLLNVSYDPTREVYDDIDQALPPIISRGPGAGSALSNCTAGPPGRRRPWPVAWPRTW